MKNLSGNSLVVPDDDQLRLMQLIILTILDDVTSYCDREGINYALGGGSALGAIRHHGFIPWDDDIDLDMPRADYDRFIKGFPKEYESRYVVQSPELTPEIGIPLCRIRLKGTVARSHDDVSGVCCGLYIEIFVVENTFNSAALRTLHGLGCMAAGLLYSCRRFYRDKEFYLALAGDNKSFAKTIRVKAAIGRILAASTMATWTKRTMAVYSLCNDNGSQYVAVPAGRGHFFRETYLRSDFVNTRRAEFEGRMLNVPRECEKYLDHHYGDYMRLPSESEREHHAYLELDLGQAVGEETEPHE
jgi:lipopolysaccharide cholinephosphotransferase